MKLWLLTPFFDKWLHVLIVQSIIHNCGYFLNWYINKKVLAKKPFHSIIDIDWLNQNDFFDIAAVKNFAEKTAYTIGNLPPASAHTSKKQEIIQKKLVSSSRMLPFVIFDKKVPFFPKMVLF